MFRLEESLKQLDRFIEQRMQAARSPALVVAFTDREKLLRLSAYGFADPEAQKPLEPDTLFQIGSISKTFTAIATLQAVAEGLLDVHAPVTEYLPWFRTKSAFEPITIHHLLSHSSGLPYSVDFSPDPRAVVYGLCEIETGFAPGSQFHYSEPGYQTLTLVLEAVRGQSFSEIIKTGIFEPLGMDASESAITQKLRPRMARGYRTLYDDRPSHASQPLVPADWLEFSSGDGCIASTAEDMSKFVRMLLNRGRGPSGTVLTEADFMLMTTPVIEDAEYGYGILAFEVDDCAYVGHAGDMPGYEAYLWLDMDNGLGMVMLAAQPYPSGLSWPVLQALRAAYLNQPAPALSLPDPTQVENASDYAGFYHAGELELALFAENEQLVLEYAGQRIILEQRGVDRFYVNHPDFDLFLLQFGRAGDGEDALVVEAFHGSGWYVNDRYAGMDSFGYPDEWTTYLGHYRAFNPWEPNFRVIARKGVLLLVRPDGDEEQLTPLEDGVFRVGVGHSPERLCFDQVVNVQALRAVLSGVPYYRFFTP